MKPPQSLWEKAPLNPPKGGGPNLRKEGWVFFILIILHHSPHRRQEGLLPGCASPLGGIEGGFLPHRGQGGCDCGFIDLNLLQRLLDIVKYVLTVLNTYRQTDKVGSDTSLFQLLV